MFGNILIILSIGLGLFSLAMYYLSFKDFQNTLKLARYSYYFMTTLILTAGGYLIYLIFNHQYQYSYIFEYSSSSLSFGLLLSSFFAGQEGSFLLWLIFLQLIGLFLIRFLSNDSKLESSFMICYILVGIFLAVLITPYLKNPFAYIWADSSYIELKYIHHFLLDNQIIQKFIATNNSNDQYLLVNKDLVNALSSLGLGINDIILQGKGLNPMLQNFWMQIHPPILFVGFAMAAIPYSFGMSALMRNRYNDFVQHSLPWTLSSMMVLGFSIMVGGYWAYGVLGWGGFWGWDPVENSSLVPWIIGVALVHTLLIQRKTQAEKGHAKFVKTNLALSLLVFITVVYSTFLTRSGILSNASVHSFVEPGMATYLVLLGFITTFSIIAILGFIFRWKQLKNVGVTNSSFLNRESGLFYGSMLLLAAAITITIGTSSPIFGSAVDIKFYNEMNIPLAILMTILIAATLFLKWRETAVREFMYGVAVYVVLSSVVTFAFFILTGINSVLGLLYIWGAVLTISVNLILLLKVIRQNYRSTGGHLAHIGFGLILLGAMLSGTLDESVEIDLPRGEKISILNHSMKFLGYEPIENNTKFAFNVEIQDGEDKRIASPVMYNSEYNNALTREPDILEGWTRDLYISPIGFDEIKDTTDISQANLTLRKGTPVKYKDVIVKLVEIVSLNGNDNSSKEINMVHNAQLELSFEDQTIPLNLSLKNVSGKKIIKEELVESAGIKLSFSDTIEKDKIAVIVSSIGAERISEPKSLQVLTVEASVKPNINLVWLGVFFVTIGFFIAAIRRLAEIQSIKNKEDY